MNRHAFLPVEQRLCGYGEAGAMRRVALVHWKSEEAEGRLEQLREAGFEAEHLLLGGASSLRQLAQDPPDALLIDLTRLPSQGRDLAVMLRKRQGTRHIPLVLVGGETLKVERVKELLPDVVHGQWEDVSAAVERALVVQPDTPIAPASQFAAYAGKPLVEKLGIRQGMQVQLVDPPEGFAGVLGSLPEGASLLEVDGASATAAELTIWFLRSRAELDANVKQVVACAESGPVWLAWPKRASSMATDLTQQIVRQTGLAAGLVDYKVCSVDETWTGLLFTCRQPQ
jgi:CheY-like chemotaxis protein